MLYLDVQKLYCPTSNLKNFHVLHTVLSHKLDIYTYDHQDHAVTLFSKPVEQQMAWKCTMKKRAAAVRQTWLLCPTKCVYKREQGRERGDREWERGRTSAVPNACCYMYSAHSSQSDFHQSQCTVPSCRASQQHGASTWPCQVPGPLAWVNKASNKTNMRVKQKSQIRICLFMQQRDECTGICAGDIGAWDSILAV